MWLTNLLGDILKLFLSAALPKKFPLQGFIPPLLQPYVDLVTAIVTLLS